jgi:hypothetical protein
VFSIVAPFPSLDGVTVTFVPANAAWRAASAAACGSAGIAGGADGAAGAAGVSFGGGIGRGRVSGAEMAGIATPIASSYVGSSASFPPPDLG